MSVSFLFLSAAVALGADAPPPAAPPAAAPAAVTVTATGCSGCGVAVCDPCAPRVGLLDRLRARWAARPRLFSQDCCPAPTCAPAPACAAPCAVAAAPACGRPVFTGFTTSCCDPCERVGLLDRLRAKFRSSRSCDACAAPLAGACCGSSVANTPVGGCTSTLGTVTSPAGGGATTPPDKMPTPMPTAPKKEEPKKEEPKKELSLQVPALTVPAVDTPRVPTLGGTSGKY